jgi:transcription-repair coupling factor (superfamily II helicase)
MRDLEIRGAGNILGTQQSGHIAAVGYELYCQLLEQAVRRLKQLAPRDVWDVNIDLPLFAFVPRTYVSDIRQKIDLYRRLARIATEGELADFRAEITDRFGRPPDEMERLLALAELRTWAGQWKIDAVYVEGEYLVFRYRDAGRIKALAANSGKQLRIVDQRSAYLPLPRPTPDGQRLLGIAQQLLHPRTTVPSTEISPAATERACGQ